MEGALIPYQNPDGTTGQVTLFDFPGGKEGAVFLVLPAMGVRAVRYAPLAIAMAVTGHTTVTADLRGKGFSSVRPSRKTDFGYREMLDQDIHSAVSLVKSRFPGKPLYLLGHSLGGQLASLYAARYPESVQGLLLIACCSVYYKGWEGRAKWRILIGTQFAGLLSGTLGYFPGKRVGFGGTNARRMMQDWSRQARTGRYELSGDVFNYEAALKKLKLPVLALSFAGDDFAPREAVLNLVGKFSKAAPVREIHLSGEDPRNEGYHHFNWPSRPDGVVHIIREWME